MAVDLLDRVRSARGLIDQCLVEHPEVGGAELQRALKLRDALMRAFEMLAERRSAIDACAPENLQEMDRLLTHATSATNVRSAIDDLERMASFLFTLSCFAEEGGRGGL